MSQHCSIIDTHNKIIKIIPENQKKLIDELINFIKIQEIKPLKYLTSKIIYVSYLHILLKYLPNRILRNSDPEWMWNCQEIFSSSILNY